MKPAWKAAAASAGLSGLFVLVYSFCNWFTGLRAGVGSWYFPWERQIPFEPLLIIPYMSIDLFFIGAPFVARSDLERRTLVGRIAAAILIAGACFLLFPLRFAFARPPVDGALGLVFNNFRTLDPPFNEFPSLHIALAIILAGVYFRHTRGLVCGLAMIWFLLIVVSPLPTFQHHAMDVLGGFFLAAFCCHFIADEPLGHGSRPVPLLAGRYGVAGAALAVLGLAGPPWLLVLLWPATALIMVAAGYACFGPGIYRKTARGLPWTTHVLLGPQLVGQYLSLCYYAAQCRPFDRLTDRLYIGRRLSGSEALQARAAGVTAVIDLACEFAECAAFGDLPYLGLPTLDLTAPNAAQIAEALAFIQRQPGIVYVHCKAGYSRTAVIAGASLLATGQAATPEAAITLLRRARPSMVIRPEALAAIHLLGASLARSSDRPATRPAPDVS